MFDIGFWEIALISIIGLVVLGPERLPTAIRSVMRWVNSARGIANSVKTEISQELKLHELNEMNDNMIKASKDGFQNLDADLQESIDEMKRSAQDLVNPYQSDSEDLTKPAVAQPTKKQTTVPLTQQDKKADE